MIPVIALAGPWPYPATATSTGIMAGAPAQLRRWMTQAFVPTLDAFDIATMANASARACPSAVTPTAEPTTEPTTGG